MTPTARAMSYEAAGKTVCKSCKKPIGSCVVCSTNGDTSDERVRETFKPSIYFGKVTCTDCLKEVGNCDCTVSDQHPVIMHNDGNTSMKDGDTITNEQGGKQSYLAADFTCLNPGVQLIIAEGLGFGKRKYGKDNYMLIPLEEHLAHAMNHINEYRRGDRSELHLVNANMRLQFALRQSLEAGDTPEHYTHPDMVKNG